MNRIGKYELIEEIGTGGLGVVYKAIHPRYEKYVALKAIRSDLARNASVQERFRHEAEVLANLPAHPNLVCVRDSLIWEGSLCLVTDYIDGGTLSDRLEAGPIELFDGAAILEQVLSALGAIHSRGIIHQDVKARNILMDQHGVPHLSDFGIAKYGGSRGRGGQMASARYAAPELIDDRLGQAGLEEQVDIYALGIVGYEMFLGEPLFRREFDQIYRAPEETQPGRWLEWHTNLGSAARDLNEIELVFPGALSIVVKRMMAKDVTHRYRHAKNARSDVQSFLASETDSRRRRPSGPKDDETVPLDIVRRSGGGGTARGQNANPYSYPSNGVGEANGDGPPNAREFRPAGGGGKWRDKSGGQRGLPAPKWTWIVGAAAALVLMASLTLFLAFMPNPGFTLDVRGAPAGSDVYVDKVRYGVSRADGAIDAAGLRPGSRTIRVAHDGYSEFEDVITGHDGEIKTVFASMKEIKSANEIDYHGSMVLIPAGEFIMGDDNHEANERPAHPVTLPDYYIDKFEVTNAQYKKFCDETNRPYPTKLPQYEQYFNNSPDSPVMGIGWDDAEAYAEHYGKRLPSEQEWEKAASWDPVTKTKREWPWGNTPDANLANLSGKPGPVGRYSGGASAYGVQDMAGNVSEWVADYYKAYPQNQASDADYGTKDKVVRGGSFVFKIENARTTYREHERPDWRAETVGGQTNKSTIGFRCVVSASDPKLREVLAKK